MANEIEVDVITYYYLLVILITKNVRTTYYLYSNIKCN